MAKWLCFYVQLLFRQRQNDKITLNAQLFLAKFCTFQIFVVYLP